MSDKEHEAAMQNLRICNRLVDKIHARIPELEAELAKAKQSLVDIHTLAEEYSNNPSLSVNDCEDTIDGIYEITTEALNKE